MIGMISLIYLKFVLISAIKKSINQRFDYAGY